MYWLNAVDSITLTFTFTFTSPQFLSTPRNTFSPHPFHIHLTPALIPLTPLYRFLSTTAPSSRFNTDPQILQVATSPLYVRFDISQGGDVDKYFQKQYFVYNV